MDSAPFYMARGFGLEDSGQVDSGSRWIRIRQVDSDSVRWIRLRLSGFGFGFNLKCLEPGVVFKFFKLERHEILEHVWCSSSVTKSPFHYFSFDLETSHVNAKLFP